MSVPDPIAVVGGITKPHVCPLNPGQRVLLTVAGGAFLCLAGLSATAATLGNAEMPELPLQLITALGGALFGSYLLLATQSQLILEDIGIELQSAIGRRGLRHAEIAGRLEYEAIPHLYGAGPQAGGQR